MPGFDSWALPKGAKNPKKPERIPLTPLQRKRAEEAAKMSDAEKQAQSQRKPWWEASSQSMMDNFKVADPADNMARLRKQMTVEEAAFDAEIEEVVITGKRALLRLRMQQAYRSPLYREDLYKKINGRIRSAEQLRRKREIARGITVQQSKRMQRRRDLELKIEYENAFGNIGKFTRGKSNRWKRRWGLIV